MNCSKVHGRLFFRLNDFLQIYFILGLLGMKCFVFVMVVGIFLSSKPIWAEMYRYKDVNGVVRFTDNLADVPETQRKGVPVYENGPAPVMPSAAEKSSGRNTTSGQNVKLPGISQSSNLAVDSSQSEELSKDPARIDQLLKIKTALDEENALFMKESLALSEEEKTISGNAAAIKVYNEKVSALNARVDDYEKRRAAFQKEADAFDAALKKRLAPAPPPPQLSSP
jgi:hypothetical protein